MADTGFIPPPLDSYQGPAPSVGATGFTPPPLSSYQGPDPDVDPHSVIGFLGSLGSSAVNLGKGAWHTVRHPLDTAASLATTVAGMGPDGPPGSWEHEVAKPAAAALSNYEKDRYGGLSNIGETLYHDPLGAAADISAIAEPLGSGLKAAGAVADAANAARTASALRTAGEASSAVGNAVNPMALPGRIVRGVANKVLPISSSLTPVEHAAVDYALNEGAPVDLATATGNGFVGSAKAILQRQPLSAGVAGEFNRNQQNWLNTRAGDLAASVGPSAPKTKLTAGLAAKQAIDNQVSAYRSTAQAAYQKLLKMAENNPETVQVGTQPNPTLDPSQPDRIPVMGAVAGPVDTSAMKNLAGPLLDEIDKTIPLAQQQMSPSVSLLRQIMARPAFVDLQTAINDNSAIQNVARTETPALKTQAQRISAALVPAYRSAIDDAAQHLGPDAYQALQNGRQATISKYELGTAIPKQINGKPVTLVNLLTAGDDASIPVLQKIQKHVPGALPGIARSTIEDIFSHSAENGGFSRVDGTLNKWNALGDETKNILFGKNTSDEITQLLQFAKLAAKNANPSGSATVGTTAALATLLMRDPLTAIAAMAGSRALAKGLFNSDVAAEVHNTGRLPTPTVPRTLKAIAAPINSGTVNTATRLNPYASNPYQ